MDRQLRRQDDPLAGTGLLQSRAEWAARGDALAASLAELIRENLSVVDGSGLEIGCQRGGLIDQIALQTGMSWMGIDPILEEESFTDGGAQIGPGRSDDIPCPSEGFDAVVLANVFEHILPEARQASLDEIWRVLKPGGILVGQIPNPYFPIESHSRLPFMGYLPIGLQHRYWCLSRVPWEHDFFVVTMRHLERHAGASGFHLSYSRPFNYPPAAIPRRVRPLARVAAPALRIFPWAWQFVFVKPRADAP
jgi:SAM-dependent methyltransferase